MPDKQWERLRAEYEGISVPAELQERLKEMNHTTIKPTAAHWGSYAVRALIAAALALTVATNVSAAAAEALAKVPVLGAFTKLVTFRNFEESTDTMQAKITTPHLTGLEDPAVEAKLNAQFDQYADALIAQYRADLAEFGEAGGHESIDSSYEVQVDNDRQLTIAMNTVIAQGGAQQINTYYTIDKQSGKLLTLADLFRADADYIGPVSKNILEQMKSQMQKDKGVVYFIEPDDMESFHKISPDQEFYVNDKGRLVIAFDEYAVAPGVMGAVSFEIPAEVTAELAAPDGLLKK